MIYIAVGDRLQKPQKNEILRKQNFIFYGCAGDSKGGRSSPFAHDFACKVVCVMPFTPNGMKSSGTGLGGDALNDRKTGENFERTARNSRPVFVRIKGI